MTPRIDPPSPTYVGPAKWHGSATNKPIKRLVVHCTAGSEPGVKGAARSTVAYSKSTSRASSFHYVRDAVECLQYVYDSVVAYHAPPNGNSLGYEFCCSLSNEGRGHWDDKVHLDMLREGAKDFARLALAYDIPIRRLTKAQARNGEKGFQGHADVRDAWGQTTHWDPGPYFPWKDFLTVVQREADLLVAPPEEKKSRGAQVDQAVVLLERAARRNAKRPYRLQRINAALSQLREIKPR